VRIGFIEVAACAFFVVVSEVHGPQVSFASSTVPNLARSCFDVMAFGPDPSGATDSTKAFQDALLAASLQNGAAVCAPAGTFQISRLTIYSSGAETFASCIANADGSHPCGLFVWTASSHDAERSYYSLHRCLQGGSGPCRTVAFRRTRPERADVDRSSAPESGVTCMANIFDLPADRIRPGALKALFTGSADTEVSPWEPLSSVDCQLVLTNRFNVAGPSEGALGALLPDVRVALHSRLAERR
jgi:hypothetical protein